MWVHVGRAAALLETPHAWCMYYGYCEGDRPTGSTTVRFPARPISVGIVGWSGEGGLGGLKENIETSSRSEMARLAHPREA